MEKMPVEDIEKGLVALGLSVEAIKGLLQVRSLRSLNELEGLLLINPIKLVMFEVLNNG